jgi:catechol 2,3-dioxygenase-like lactoylglutathione lyase family enzyme
MKTTLEGFGPLAQSVDCIRLAVSDPEAGLTFYRDLLGHELVRQTENSVGLRMFESKTEIVLHTESGPPEIDLKVHSTDMAAVRFKQAGGTITVPPFDIQIGRAVVVQDPWGNQLVLLDDSKDFLVTDDE